MLFYSLMSQNITNSLHFPGGSSPRWPFMPALLSISELQMLSPPGIASGFLAILQLNCPLLKHPG